jgi:hypothetical protein
MPGIFLPEGKEASFILLARPKGSESRTRLSKRPSFVPIEGLEPALQLEKRGRSTLHSAGAEVTRLDRPRNIR